MSRLIDADALIERLDKRKTYEAMDGRNKAYVKGVRDAMKDVASAPTDIAIPVEWLRGLMIVYANINTPEHAACAYCLNNVIEEWQKEQEAR